jgi:hypothetical protein
MLISEQTVSNSWARTEVVQSYSQEDRYRLWTSGKHSGVKGQQRV